MWYQTGWRGAPPAEATTSSRTCSCRDEATGQKLGKACPKLRRPGGGGERWSRKSPRGAGTRFAAGTAVRHRRPGNARRFLHRSPRRPRDGGPCGVLVETLAAWLAARGSTEATARRLGVHRHTFSNRMERITRGDQLEVGHPGKESSNIGWPFASAS
ncbi:helix-turn-helix domain-containing protein [Nonomuraea sp. M3C6]|uniref:Helix-turn-helix domain-containing protein n=1 Tax=Nonomuraea marmarensis TaxID=3351344 RepID=A0ABW7ARC6_9ACTN